MQDIEKTIHGRINIKKTAIILSPSATDEEIRKAITAARLLDTKYCDIWAFGIPEQRLCLLPVDTVFLLTASEPFLPEQHFSVLTKLAGESSPDVFLFTGGHAAIDLAAKMGCALEGSCALSITNLKYLSTRIVATRRVYGLQLEAELEFYKSPYVFSLDAQAFEPAVGDGNPLLKRCFDRPAELPWCTDCIETYVPAEHLQEHDLVLIGGRGIGSSETAEELKALGALLDAGIGSTRPAVWNSWFSECQLVGLSGQIISPNVCIVFGASGCTPFIKGIESRLLVAVNQDPNALIFSHCDLGLVDDCREIIAELMKLV